MRRAVFGAVGLAAILAACDPSKLTSDADVPPNPAQVVGLQIWTAFIQEGKPFKVTAAGSGGYGQPHATLIYGGKRYSVDGPSIDVSPVGTKSRTVRFEYSIGGQVVAKDTTFPYWAPAPPPPKKP